MDIQTEKLDLIEWISKLNDSSVIKKLRSIKENYAKSKDWYADLDEEELASIDRGLKDIDEGRLNDHDAAQKIYEKYL